MKEELKKQEKSQDTSAGKQTGAGAAAWKSSYGKSILQIYQHGFLLRLTYSPDTSKRKETVQAVRPVGPSRETGLSSPLPPTLSSKFTVHRHGQTYSYRYFNSIKIGSIK